MNQENEVLNSGVWMMFEGHAYTRIRGGSCLVLVPEHEYRGSVVARLWLLGENGWELLREVSEGINNPGFYYDPAFADKRVTEVKEHGNLVRRLMDYTAILYGDRLYLPDCTEVTEADYNLVRRDRPTIKGAGDQPGQDNTSAATGEPDALRQPASGAGRDNASA